MNRTGFIGGSDCVRIMEGDWLNLWMIKTGRRQSEDLSDSIAVQLGIATEHFNLSWFEKQNNCVLTGHQTKYLDSIGKVPVAATVDAVFNSSIVEAKHTNSMNNMWSVIERYMPQVQLYCHVSKSNGVYMSVIFGNNKWESAYVSYDKEYFDSMWAVVSDFWGYVIRDEQPVDVEIPIIETNKIAVDQMVRRNASADNHFISAAHDYIQNQAAAKAFDNAKKDLKAMIADNEREVYCDLLTIKRSKNGSLLFTVR